MRTTQRTIDIQPLLSESGHAVTERGGTAGYVNRRLEEARRGLSPLPCGDAQLSLTHIHFGPGIHAHGAGATIHRHEQIQVEYVVSGAFRFRDPDVAVTLTAGEGVAIPPGHPHEWACREDGLMLGMDVMVSGAASQALLNSAFEHGREGSALTTIDTPLLAGGMARLLESFAERNDAWQRPRASLLLGLWFCDLLQTLWPRIPAHIEEDLLSRDRLIYQRARQFLRENCALPMRLEDIAVELGVSVRHLSRIYRRHAGNSIGADLSVFRLERARRMLIEQSDAPIKTVAYECGFNSPAYFSARYRRHFGHPPGRERPPRASQG